MPDIVLTKSTQNLLYSIVPIFFAESRRAGMDAGGQPVPQDKAIYSPPWQICNDLSFWIAVVTAEPRRLVIWSDELQQRTMSQPVIGNWPRGSLGFNIALKDMEEGKWKPRGSSVSRTDYFLHAQQQQLESKENQLSHQFKPNENIRQRCEPEDSH